MIRESIFEQLRRIPEDLQAVSAELDNWAHWSRDRLRKGHCRSIEYRYKSPDIWQDNDPRIEWDSLAAERTHGHVCALPERQRWLIHLHVLWKAPEGYIRRKLGIRRDEMVREVHQAMRMVRNRASSLDSVL